MSYYADNQSGWTNFMNYNMVSIAYDSVLGFFIAISNSGDILSSTNGISWILVKSYPGYVFKSVKYIENTL